MRTSWSVKRYINLPSGEKMMFAFCRSSLFGQGIVRTILEFLQVVLDGGRRPISNRSDELVADAVTMR